MCTLLIIRLKRILMIDTHKIVIKYKIEHKIHYVNKYINNLTSLQMARISLIDENLIIKITGIVWSMGIINKPTFEPNKVLNLVYCRLRCPTLDRNRFLHIHIRVVRLLGYTHKGVYKFLDNFLILFSWTYFVWAQNYFFNLHCLHLFMLNMIPSNYIGW